jgi:hypothetical protein
MDIDSHGPVTFGEKPYRFIFGLVECRSPHVRTPVQSRTCTNSANRPSDSSSLKSISELYQRRPTRAPYA